MAVPRGRTETHRNSLPEPVVYPLTARRRALPRPLSRADNTNSTEPTFVIACEDPSRQREHHVIPVIAVVGEGPSSRGSLPRWRASAGALCTTKLRASPCNPIAPVISTARHAHVAKGSRTRGTRVQSRIVPDCLRRSRSGRSPCHHSQAHAILVPPPADRARGCRSAL